MTNFKLSAGAGEQVGKGADIEYWRVPQKKALLKTYVLTWELVINGISIWKRDPLILPHGLPLELRYTRGCRAWGIYNWTSYNIKLLLLPSVLPPSPWNQPPHPVPVRQWYVDVLKKNDLSWLICHPHTIESLLQLGGKSAMIFLF